MEGADVEAHVVDFAISEAPAATVHAADREAIGSQGPRRAATHALDCDKWCKINSNESVMDGTKRMIPLISPMCMTQCVSLANAWGGERDASGWRVASSDLMQPERACTVQVPSATHKTLLEHAPACNPSPHKKATARRTILMTYFRRSCTCPPCFSACYSLVPLHPSWLSLKTGQPDSTPHAFNSAKHSAPPVYVDATTQFLHDVNPS